MNNSCGLFRKEITHCTVAHTVSKGSRNCWLSSISKQVEELICLAVEWHRLLHQHQSTPQADRKAKDIRNQWETTTVVGQLPYIKINEGWAQRKFLKVTAGIKRSPTGQRLGTAPLSAICE